MVGHIFLYGFIVTLIQVVRHVCVKFEIKPIYWHALFVFRFCFTYSDFVFGWRGTKCAFVTIISSLERGFHVLVHDVTDSSACQSRQLISVVSIFISLCFQQFDLGPQQTDCLFALLVRIYWRAFLENRYFLPQFIIFFILLVQLILQDISCTQTNFYLDNLCVLCVDFVVQSPIQFSEHCDFLFKFGVVSCGVHIKLICIQSISNI
jgi:hypothetical protein